MKKVLAGVLGAVFLLGFVGVAQAATVSGNTSNGYNELGWMFNRDVANQTVYTFSSGNQSIGSGSLFVAPILNTIQGASDKFIAENFLLTPIADIVSITYDFKLATGLDESKGGHFYMNVYANFGDSLADKFYDCKFDVALPTGSDVTFTTVTFDTSLTYPVITRGDSPRPCPASPAGMDALSPTGSSTIRAFAINVGDTSMDDTDVGGYLDNVVVTKVGSDITTYDFEPAPFPVLTFTLPPSVSVNQSALLSATGGVADDNSAVSAALAGVTPFSVRLTNTGNAATAPVRINPLNAGANIQIWAQAPDDNWYDVNVIGWGEALGMILEPGFDQTTNTYAVSDTAGVYPLAINLAVASNPATILATGNTTVNVLAPQTITFASLEAKTYDEADFTVSATSDSGLAVSFSASGACTVTGNLVHLAGAGNCDVTASQAGNSVFSSATPVTQSFAVAQKPVTVSATANQRFYDGTNEAEVNLTVDGLVGSDVVTANGTGVFSDKNVGVGKLVNISGITLGGADAGNYSLALTTAVTSATISPVDLEVTASASNKVYDGATNATVTLSDDRITGDDLTVTFASALFGDANAGNNKTVTVSGISLSGPDALNYTANSSDTDQADITAKPLSVTASNVSKTYDGLAFSGGTVTYDGFANSENESALGGTLVLGGDSQGAVNAGAYDITPSGLTSTNYSIDFVSGTLTINKADAVISVPDVTVTYDGNSHGVTGTAVGIGAVDLSGLLNLGDSFRNVPGGTANWAFAGDMNYNSTNGVAEVTITPRAITIRGAADTKVYDGTVTSSAIPTIAVGGPLVAGDTHNFSQTFASKDVAGPTKTTRPSSSSSVNDGNGGNNYLITTLDGANGTITAKPVTVTVTVDDKEYDSTTAATISIRNLDGVVDGETITATGGVAVFADANVSNNKNVTVSGMTLSGTGTGNYSFAGTASTQANITQKLITVTANNLVKAYGSADPVLTHNGVLMGTDVFSGVLARVSGESVGTYAVSQGTLNAGSNYSMAFVPGTLTISDQNAPVITLNGDSAMSLFEGNFFADPGATGVDNLDASVVVNVSGTVNPDLAGTYTLTYTAVDTSGNVAVSLTRTVVVKPVNRSNGRAQFARGVTVVVPNTPAGPVVGEVLGASIDPVVQAKIVEIRTQLSSLISQLIGLLQAQLAAAVTAQNQ
jgi:hypothetical protein